MRAIKTGVKMKHLGDADHELNQQVTEKILLLQKPIMDYFSIAIWPKCSMEQTDLE